MKFDEYSREAATTAIYPREHALAYPTLGLIEEVQEFVNVWHSDADDAAVIKELGDILWYCAAVSRDLGVEITGFMTDDLTEPSCRVDNIVDQASFVCGRVKKTLRGDSDYSDEIIGGIQNILTEISGLCLELDTTIEVCMRVNLAKLFDRQERGVLQGDGDNR